MSQNSTFGTRFLFWIERSRPDFVSNRPRAWKVEKTLNPVLNSKVLTYISTPYNLQVGFYKSLVFYCFSDTEEHFERVEFFDPRETLYIPINLPTHFKRQVKHKHQARGAAQAVRPPATSERKRFAQDRREKPGRGDGRPNSKLLGSREEDHHGRRGGFQPVARGRGNFQSP